MLFALKCVACVTRKKRKNMHAATTSVREAILGRRVCTHEAGLRIGPDHLSDGARISHRYESPQIFDPNRRRHSHTAE